MSDIEQHDVESLPELDPHDGPFHMFEEHGGDWVTCLLCGATWSIHESSGKHLCVEEVSAGDETCPSEEGDNA
jgi:hypothetical protein